MNTQELVIDPRFDLTGELPKPRIVEIDAGILPPEWRELCKRERIRFHLVLMYENWIGTGKAWAAAGIIARGISRGDHGTSDTAIDSTSGNYGVAFAKILAELRHRYPDFPIKRLVAVVSRKLPKGKRERLLECGIELIDAENAIDAMRVAEELAKKKGFWYTKQYQNTDNSWGFRVPAEAIAEALPTLGMFACGVGSGGTITGVMPILSERFAGREFGFHRVAVVVEEGEVGGVRNIPSLENNTLRWWDVDSIRYVSARKSCTFSSALWLQGDEHHPSDAYPVGESAGFVSEGDFLAVRELSDMRKLGKLRAPDGFVHIAVPAMDLRMPYRDEYAEMGIYRPDSAWEPRVFD